MAFVIIIATSLVFVSCDNGSDDYNESQFVGLWELTDAKLYVTYKGKRVEEDFSEKARIQFYEDHTCMSYTWISNKWQQDFSERRRWSLSGNKIKIEDFLIEDDMGGEGFTILKLTKKQCELYFKQKNREGIVYENYVTFTKISSQ